MLLLDDAADGVTADGEDRAEGVLAAEAVGDHEVDESLEGGGIAAAGDGAGVQASAVAVGEEAAAEGAGPVGEPIGPGLAGPGASTGSMAAAVISAERASSRARLSVKCQ